MTAKPPATENRYPVGVCAEEDFCKGCGNFDNFFNSCKLARYVTSIEGKRATIYPRTNETRWLLSIVGCSSDTRSRPAPAQQPVFNPEQTFPVCPACKSPLFWNNTDGADTLFCINDECKWKQALTAQQPDALAELEKILERARKFGASDCASEYPVYSKDYHMGAITIIERVVRDMKYARSRGDKR